MRDIGRRLFFRALSEENVAVCEQMCYRLEEPGACAFDCIVLGCACSGEIVLCKYPEMYNGVHAEVGRRMMYGALHGRMCGLTHAFAYENADLWEILAVWSGELGDAEVQERALAHMARVESVAHRNEDPPFSSQSIYIGVERKMLLECCGVAQGEQQDEAHHEDWTGRRQGVMEAEKERLSLMQLCSDPEVGLIMYFAMLCTHGRMRCPWCAR